MVGNFFDHATLPVAASIATNSPAPLVGSNELAWNAVDVYCAGRSSTAANTIADGGRPQLLACVRVVRCDDAGLAGPDDLGRLRAVRTEEDRGALEVEVEQVVRTHLVVPLQLASAVIQRDDRARVQVVARTAAAVRLAGNAGPRRRIAGPPIAHAGRLVDRRWVPGAAPAVHLRIAPQVRGLDGVERPRDLPGVGVERGDDPAVAARVEARLVARNGACVHQAVVRDGLDVDARRWTLHERRRPSLIAGGR